MHLPIDLSSEEDTAEKQSLLEAWESLRIRASSHLRKAHTRTDGAAKPTPVHIRAPPSEARLTSLLGQVREEQRELAEEILFRARDIACGACNGQNSHSRAHNVV